MKYPSYISNSFKNILFIEFIKKNKFHVTANHVNRIFNDIHSHVYEVRRLVNANRVNRIKNDARSQVYEVRRLANANRINRILNDTRTRVYEVR